VLTRDACKKNDFKSMIVVTEPYHTRRSYYTFRKVFKGSGIRVMLYPVQNSWYKVDDWWKTRSGFRLTGEEYVKLVYYLIRGYI
jgi:uncharacterized SAM-binding protein YcdF (DUF218 family)